MADTDIEAPLFTGRPVRCLIGADRGVFMLQEVTGVVIDLFDSPGGIYPLDADRAAFAVEALVLCLVLLIDLRAHDPANEVPPTGRIGTARIQPCRLRIAV